jgi:hypothetical protein
MSLPSTKDRQGRDLTPEQRKEHAEAVMRFVSKLSPEMRAIVSEYGVEFVHGMWLDGHRDPVKLRADAEKARQRCQEQYGMPIYA